MADTRRKTALNWLKKRKLLTAFAKCTPEEAEETICELIKDSSTSLSKKELKRRISHIETHFERHLKTPRIYKTIHEVQPKRKSVKSKKQEKLVLDTSDQSKENLFGRRPKKMMKNAKISFGEVCERDVVKVLYTLLEQRGGVYLEAPSAEEPLSAMEMFMLMDTIFDVVTKK